MGQIKINKIDVSSKKISSNIVLISDIHYSGKEDLVKLNRVLDKIKAIKTDYICILGDVCDQARVLDEDLLIEWLTDLSKVSKVIMVLGNHDYVLHKKHKSYINKKLIDKIKSIKNLYLLNNEVKVENGICFIGMELDYNYYYKYNESQNNFIRKYNNLITKLDSNKFNILLSHSPIALTKASTIPKLNDYKNIDLILCGHMHGGLMPDFLRPIFKHSGLVSPNTHNLFVKNAYGNFKIENTNFIVSSGITKLSQVSNLSYFDRFFSPEIIVIDIDFDK